jgi:hypothetical protein
MAFIDPHCRAIAAKAANGSLTESEILDAFARIDERKRRLEAQGVMTGKGERMRKWAAEEGERTKIAAALARRHTGMNVLIRDKVNRQVHGMIAGGMKPHRALRAVLEGINSPLPGSRASAFANAQAYEARYIGGLFGDLARERPHLAHMLGDEKLDVDVLTEMWELRDGGTPGSTKNEDAKYLAKKFADYAEMSRTDLNRLGATIGKLDGWAGVQMHDPIKMIQAGKEAWVGRITTLLDHERTFPEGVSSTEAADILGDIYDTIITGVPNQTRPAVGRVNPANLAKQLGKSRVLHFQDAQATLSYRDQFGYGNTISGMFSHLRQVAQKAGAMETLGPNPEMMFRSIADGLQRWIKDSKTIPDAQKPKLITKLNTEAGTLKHAIDITTGLVSRPVDVTTAKIGADLRALQVMGKLGAALPSSFGDAFTAAIASQFRGSGFFKGLMTQLGGVMQGRPKAQQAAISYLYGEGIDGMLGHIANLGYANDGPLGALGRLQENFFKWNGLTWWTDVNRSVAARVIGAELGMNAGKAMDALDPQLRHVLQQAGVTEPEWKALGKVTLTLDNGKPYLTPDRVLELPDADLVPLVEGKVTPEKIADARRRLQLKLLSYVADQTSYAVVESDARTRRYTTGGLQAGTLGGEAVRLIMQFKGYPLGFTTRVWGRALFGQRADAKGFAAQHITTMLGGLMIAGYLSLVAKDMLKGYWPPRNPADPRTILAAWQQGGGLGIYGDYLFSQTNRFGGSLQETLAGPTIGEIGQFWDIFNDARNYAVTGGEDAFSKTMAFNTILGSVPYANLHLVKPSLDFLILNAVRDALSPGSVQKQIRNRRKEYSQDYVPAQITGKPGLDPLSIASSFWETVRPAAFPRSRPLQPNGGSVR